MANTAYINARIDSTTKTRAIDIFHSLGLNVSQAISMYFMQVIYNNGIPFEIKLPNKTTQQAIEELESGKGERFSTAKELFKDLEH